jgi:hypothetical protein
MIHWFDLGETKIHWIEDSFSIQWKCGNRKIMIANGNLPADWMGRELKATSPSDYVCIVYAQKVANFRSTGSTSWEEKSNYSESISIPRASFEHFSGYTLNEEQWSHIYGIIIDDAKSIAKQAIEIYKGE